MTKFLPVLLFASCGFLSCCGDGETRYIERRPMARSPNEHDVTPPYFRKTPRPRPTIVPLPKLGSKDYFFSSVITAGTSSTTT